jgi:potassium-transporting ATPase ATP-binding subunit
MCCSWTKPAPSLSAPGVTEADLADAAQLASLADETPEGRSIVVLAKEAYGLRERNIHTLGATFLTFSAQTRMSGVDLHGRCIRKGALDAMDNYLRAQNSALPTEVRRLVEEIAKSGGTP